MEGLEERMTKKEAKRQHLPTYYTGILCKKHAHDCRRSIHNAECIMCLLMRRQETYQTRVAEMKGSMVIGIKRIHRKKDLYLGKRLTINHRLVGMISGVVIKSTDHHIWIRDHGQRRLEPVTMVPKRWIVEGGEP